MLPIVRPNWGGWTIARAALQVRPKSRVVDIIAGLLTNRPSASRVNRSHTWYAEPTRTGSAVTAFLSSMNSGSVSAITGVVLRHVLPPSYDVVATTALRGVSASKLNALP